MQAQYQANGNAVSVSASCYRLTANTASQAGSAWNLTPLNLNQPFDLYFNILLGCSDGGADGMAFVLQTSSTALGAGGGGMGFQGLTQSFAVEFDTYQNSNFGDLLTDHIAIMSNGSVDHTSANNLAGPVSATPFSANVEDCADHLVQFSWNPGTSTFSVYFDCSLRLTYTGNIAQNFFGGNPSVLWGWTAGTGALANEHRFCVTTPNFVASVNKSGDLGCTGPSVSLTATPATAASYSWSNGAVPGPGLNTAVVSAAGTYTVTVTQSNGCSSTASVTVNSIGGSIPPVSAAKSGDLSCTNTSVTLFATPVTGATYVWSGGATPIAGTGNATATAAGTYTVVVTAPNGCSAIASVTVSSTGNTIPVSLSKSGDLGCAVSSVTLTASSVAGATFSWSAGATPAVGGSATVTAAGNYTVTASSNGCTSTASVTVSSTTNLPPITLNKSGDLSCTLNTVVLSATAVPGATFSWSAGATPSGAGSATVTAAGAYSVTASLNGCTAAASIAVSSNNTPVSAGITHAGFLNCNTGSATLTATPAIGMSYAWSGGATPVAGTNTATINAPGTYTVVVTDLSNGCTGTAAATLVNASVNAGPTQVIPVNSSASLTAQYVGPASGQSCAQYSQSTIARATYTLSAPINISLANELVSNAIPIGFSFNFYCNNYTQLYVSSNGWLSFSATTLAAPTPAAIPNAAAPNNLIAFAWDDLDPSIAPVINYRTIGTAPNRVFVLNAAQIRHSGCISRIVSCQVHLIEGSNIIEIHTPVAPNATGIQSNNCNNGPMTMGIENANGTTGTPVPGRNNQVWNANNTAVRFEPVPLLSYTWAPANLLNDPRSPTPVTSPLTQSQWFWVTVTDGTCTWVDSVLIQVGALSASELYFEGREEAQVAALYWQSRDDAGAHSYILERRDSQNDFHEIFRTKACDSSRYACAYSYADETPLRGTNYYRLKRIGRDGTIQQTQVLALYFGQNEAARLNLRVTSGGNLLQFEADLEQPAQFQLSLYDLQGRCCAEIPARRIEAGRMRAELPITGLSPGVYLYRMRVNGQMLSGKTPIGL